ncbi:MAG TPA: VWA domain-containing protein [Firmicutes bacterium]|nr:VWA domain-containing protein [Bacillota bacterium]
MKLRTVLNHSFVVMNEANTVYLLVEVEAPSMERPASRRPLNLSIVLDRSGSMAGGKLEHAKSAAAFVVRNLCDEDSISVVTFDDKVDTPVPSRPVVEHEKAEIIRLIEDISCGNTTNLSGGLLMGCYQVRQALSDDRISRVILLSDGQANEGIVNPSILVSKAVDSGPHWRRRHRREWQL